MKTTAFIKNAILLNRELNVLPLMYGSVGLSYLLGADLQAQDVDILIPSVFINEKWHEFKHLLNSNGYTLADAHEHTFEKDGIFYSYAAIEELETFAGIKACDISLHTLNRAQFLLLNPEQYLKVYTKSQTDGYRITVRNKKDAEKINLIKSYLNPKTP